mmetsp:Transcript_29032/g.76102  ORF Transcript_29032/g.76102 Transcript_29032/m.76102 type:complete len:88 (+) Transcript_29032:1435-1698(+)
MALEAEGKVTLAVEVPVSIAAAQNPQPRFSRIFETAGLPVAAALPGLAMPGRPRLMKKVLHLRLSHCPACLRRKNEAYNSLEISRSF